MRSAIASGARALPEVLAAAADRTVPDLIGPDLRAEVVAQASARRQHPMLEALIRGERDPHTLAGLARGRKRAQHAELIEALTGQFDDHHGELARIMLDQVDGLTRQIDQLTVRIDELIAAIPVAAVPDHDGDDTGDGATRALPAVHETGRDPGIGQSGAQAILAEVGLDMTRVPTPERLVSWAKLCPRTIQSVSKNTSGKAGKANPYLKSSAKRPQVLPAPTPSSVNATGDW